MHELRSAYDKAVKERTQGAAKLSRVKENLQVVVVSPVNFSFQRPHLSPLSCAPQCPSPLSKPALRTTSHDAPLLLPLPVCTRPPDSPVAGEGQEQYSGEGQPCAAQHPSDGEPPG